MSSIQINDHVLIGFIESMITEADWSEKDTLSEKAAIVAVKKMINS